MKLNNIILLLFLFSLLACQKNRTTISKERKESITSAIENLKTDEQKSDYLYQLWQEDQGKRKGQENKIIEQHGYNSNQHNNHRAQSVKKQKQIFFKIKTYLEIHGYPGNPENYHELAINAFPIIIGHNHNFDQQKEVLPYLYEAYKNNKCSLEDVVWVLGEMYESKHSGERYQMESNRYTTKAQFIALNKVMNLNLN